MEGQLPPLVKHTKVEDGMVMGSVAIGMRRKTFEICTVEEWVEMSEEEAEEIAHAALFESGIIDWWY
jgi:hypothetical protein